MTWRRSNKALSIKSLPHKVFLLCRSQGAHHIRGECINFPLCTLGSLSSYALEANTFPFHTDESAGSSSFHYKHLLPTNLYTPKTHRWPSAPSLAHLPACLPTNLPHYTYLIPALYPVPLIKTKWLALFPSLWTQKI